MHIHFIIHESFEAPGAYESWANHKHHVVSYTRLYAGEQLPEQVDHIDFLIVMGGPQSPDTTTCAYFDANKEQAFILQLIQANKMVLGVCLGAQLIGEALGASYQPSPQKEIGKFPITLTDMGIEHPLFAHFDRVIEVGHWHNDMPGLTPEATIIAYSEGCPRQIIAYTPRVFGFQCHMELNREVVAQLIAQEEIYQEDSNVAAQYRFVDTPEQLLNHDYDEMNNVLYDFLDKLTAGWAK